MSDDDQSLWWGKPFDARRYHIFEGEGRSRSLCGNWAFANDGKEPEVDPDEDSFSEGDDCKTCSRKAGVLES